MATIKSLRIMMYVDHKAVKQGLDKVKKSVSEAARDMGTIVASAFAADRVGKSVVKGIKDAMEFESFAVDLAVLGGDGAGLFDKLKNEAKVL